MKGLSPSLGACCLTLRGSKRSQEDHALTGVRQASGPYLSTIDLWGGYLCRKGRQVHYTMFNLIPGLRRQEKALSQL